MSDGSERIQRAGGVLVKVPGRRDAWRVGSRLIWLIPSQRNVLVGYLHNPDQQGTLMSLSQALSVAADTESESSKRD